MFGTGDYTMDNLEDYEKKIFSMKDLEVEDLKKLITKISDFAKVSPDGFVSIINLDTKKVTDKERIHLVLCVRYLLNNLQVKIGRENPVNADVTVDELAKILKKPPRNISARVSELKDENAIDSLSKGVYRVRLHTIDGLIEKLNKIKMEEGK
jgi:hypothetical protein